MFFGGVNVHMRKISNPLTIIGIFAGIAEVAGTAVLPLMSESLQKIFIWYVMGFPILLVLLFFITLNVNPKVLYAPSDFKDEKNFMELIRRADKIIDDVVREKPSVEKAIKPLEELIEKTAVKFDDDIVMDDNKADYSKVTNKNSHCSFSGWYVGRDNISCIRASDIKGYVSIGDKKYEVEKEIILGKSMAEDICMSRKHAKIENRKGEFYLIDLDSSNGTYINGMKLCVGEEMKLSDGDIVRMGRTDAVFSIC